jgi:hypothetical protein
MTEIEAAAETYDIEINDPALEGSGFTKFSLPLNGKCSSSSNTMMVLWNEDRSKIIYCRFYKSDLDRTVKSLEQKLLSSDELIDDNTAKSLVTYFRNQCLVLREDRISGFFNGNEKSKSKSDNKQQKQKQQEEQQQPQPKQKNIFLQRHTEENIVAEAVIIGGKPYFAVASPKVGNPDNAEVSVIVSLVDAIQLDENTILKPLESISYINKPYSFKSKQEFEKLVEDTRGKSLDSIYRKVKSIWLEYINADDFHISLCAADTIFTYFQDKIGLTHYPFFVGGNNSGKSNNLTVLHFLAYRNMLSSSMTAANIYQFLGSSEEGLGTICEDEADNIDEDHDKMRIYKNGYTTGIPVFRTDISSVSGRNQLRLNTFCFKAFAAEKLPDSTKARGFNQRVVPLPCTYGFPKYDISEVVNPAGDEEYQQLLDELLEVHNTLLVYRLLHFKNKIPNIQLNIENREKQLFKPVIRVFQNTETLNELLPVISKYVSQKRESNANTLHAFLYRTVKELTEAQNTYELESSLIWNTITDLLHGSDIPNKPLSFESSEFGIISQREIVQTLRDVFGAERSRDEKKKRSLIFDKSKLEKLSKIYELSIEIKVEKVTHGPLGPLVGLDRHLSGPSDDKETAINQQQTYNNSNTRGENSNEVKSETDTESRPHSTQVDQVVNAAPDMSESIYRQYPHSDKWACYDCKLTGDRWFMKKHDCSMSKRREKKGREKK